jgi:hypothetical protein
LVLSAWNLFTPCVPRGLRPPALPVVFVRSEPPLSHCRFMRAPRG